MYLSVVVPVCNESDIVCDLYDRVAAVFSGEKLTGELVVVDDGSSDGTSRRLREHHAARNALPLQVVTLTRNFGQTAALAAGVDFAKGEVIITMDGDLQHHPEDIPRFLEKLKEGYDVVSGARAARADNLVLRRVPSKVANWLMRRLSRVEVQDFGSTFKAYRANIVRQIEFFGELHRFLPVLADHIGARMTEIPITTSPRSTGASHYGLGRVFGVFEDILFLYFYTQYLTRPIRAFGKLFMLFFGSGFGIAALLLILWACGVIGAVYEHAALLLFSVFLMIIGVQFLVGGVVAELLARVYHHTRQTKIYTVREVTTQCVE